MVNKKITKERKNMKDNISSAITVTFAPCNKIDEVLIDFLDSYFEVCALNYTDDGQEQYVGYADLSFNQKHFEETAQKSGVALPTYKVEILKNKNWLTENVIQFPAMEVGDFCIYGIHEKTQPKTKKIPIRLYAVTAFGSTHQTTHMCLNAICDLARSGFVPAHILDVGTGSGILSVAAAKKWKKQKPQVLGVDIDRESVNVAGQNVYDNDVQNFIDIIYSNGFKAKRVKETAPYDLIFANILARPLISMAKDMFKSLKPSAYAILSGFTYEQTDWVLGVYKKAGFKLVKLYQNEHWRAALIQKKETILNLQSKLAEHEAIWVKRDNMFLGEDILDCENKISELTNFTGSAGMLLVLKNKAFLFVDGRYSIQARKETSAEISVVDVQTPWLDLIRVLQENNIKTLKFNPWAVSKAEVDFMEKSNLSLSPDTCLPISSLNLPQKVFKHPLRFAGLSSKEKCAAVVSRMPRENDALLISSAAEVSWLANLRARDLPETPVLRAYGLLYRTGKLKIYSFANMKTLIDDLKKCKNVAFNNFQTPFALAKHISNTAHTDFSALSMQKLQKNPVEIQGFIKSHVRDGVAMVRFLSWLEAHYQGLTELDVVQKLHDFRALGKNYFSESFGTIAAINSNAAIVHYQPTSKTNKRFSKNALLLLDSGAQYFDGTTDITRTVGFGHLKKEIKQDFTLVLKAHIALASTIFKEGTKANELDLICRQVLLSQGKDFKHGTGHSVGHFSNVHEPPFSINERNQTSVQAHYITSIEPGFYEENKYGIRIENLVYTTPAEKKGYLRFEPLTLCPIDLSLADVCLLSKAEKKWLNNYHQKVFEALSPFLNKAERNWLEGKCRKI